MQRSCGQAATSLPWLFATAVLDGATRTRLQALYGALDPVVLLREIEVRQAILAGHSFVSAMRTGSCCIEQQALADDRCWERGGHGQAMSQPDIVAVSGHSHLDPWLSVNSPDCGREPLTPPGVSGSNWAFEAKGLLCSGGGAANGASS